MPNREAPTFIPREEPRPGQGNTIKLFLNKIKDLINLEFLDGLLLQTDCKIHYFNLNRIKTLSNG